jgi:hypothetical protein
MGALHHQSTLIGMNQEDAAELVSGEIARCRRDQVEKFAQAHRLIDRRNERMDPAEPSREVSLRETT